MSETVNIYEAKTRLSALVERAASGEEIVIARNGKPRARLVPLGPARFRPRRPGGGEDIRIGEDFDEPLPAEIAEAIEDPR